MDLEVNIKCKWPLLTALVVLAGKEYVGIVRLHNAIESEAQLARVSLGTLKRAGTSVAVVSIGRR